MLRLLTSIGMALVALLVSAPVALAQVSASYRMQDNNSDYGSDNAGASPSYGDTDQGVTWYESGLTSNNYSLNAEPNLGTSSSTSAPATSDTSGGGTANGGGAHSGGGSHAHPAAGPGSATASSAASHSSSASSHPRTRPTRKPAAGTPDKAPNVPATTAPVPGLPLGIPGIATLLAGESLRTAILKQEFRLHFFDAVDPPYAPQVTHPVAEPPCADWHWTALGLAGLLGGGNAVWLKRKRIRKYLRKKRNRKIVACVLGILLSLTLGAVLLGLPSYAHAANDTTPLLRTYKGNLLNSAGQPITSAVTIRFSYWKSSDYVTTDTTSTGAVNTGAPNYAGWNEVQTVTPNTLGYFSVQLGSVTPLMDFTTMPTATLVNLHLQVEVKASGAPDSSYELLDVNAADPTLDRSRITTVPFARNADLLDQHDTGTGSFNIPVLDMSGFLPTSTMPGGTNQNTFVIDSDDSAASEVVLQFGTTIAKKLTYDKTNGWFNFNDDVHIQGDLTVTGLINGIDVGSLQGSTGALKAFAGAGLNIGVSGGSYRINGVVTNYLGATGVAVPANATSMVFFGSGGLTVSTGGFPTDESYIPVAQVTTNATNVLTVADRRVMNSDDRESTVQTVFNAEYEHSSYQGDGTDNVGQLTVSNDNATKNNFYLWTSSRPTLQDYDILLKAHLSPNFVRWKTGATDNAFSLDYRTTTASNAANKLDIQVYDTNGVPVSLSGAVTGLASTSWANTQLEMGNGGTWTPGQDFLIRIRGYAKDNFQVQLGTLKLQSVELRKE